jgi:hypothetical protein
MLEINKIEMAVIHEEHEKLKNVASYERRIDGIENELI